MSEISFDSENGFSRASSNSPSAQVSKSSEGLDEFLKDRLEWMTQVAAEFDAKGGGDPDRFLRHCAIRKVRESSLPGAVQLMTIHKSKGLEFDVVLLPELVGRAFDAIPTSGLMQSKEADGTVKWMLQRPPRQLCQYDPILTAHLEEEKAAQAYEALCLLYVAMTRAKQALYMLAPPKPKNAKHAFSLLKEALVTEKRFLPESLGELPAEILWQEGDPLWFEKIPGKKGAESKVQLQPHKLDTPAESRVMKPLRRVRPSAEAHATVNLRGLLEVKASDGLIFGQMVHRLFENWGWSDETDWASMEEAWKAAGLDHEALYESAKKHVLRCWETTEVRALLAKPNSDQAILWREKSFEQARAGEWISGTFDRVQLELDESGKPVGAMILDYKTDRADTEEERENQRLGYLPQLARYREVLAHITGIEVGKVGTALIFTGEGKVAWCHPKGQ